MHPYLATKLAEAHRDDLLRQARSARLAALVPRGRRRAKERHFVRTLICRFTAADGCLADA